jgi:hypothetical protein
MGNDAKETARLVQMSDEHARRFSALFFREFFKGKNYQNDTQIRSTVALAKRAAAAGADVFYVTARTQSEEPYTIAQLSNAGLPDVDANHVVSKPKMKDKTPDFKANELKELTESVTSVLLETKFSGDRPVADDTPIWKVDVK